MFGPISTIGLNPYTTHSLYYFIKNKIKGKISLDSGWPQLDHHFDSREERNRFHQESNVAEILDFFEDKRADVELLRVYFSGGDWRSVWKWGAERYITDGDIEKAFERVASFD